MGWLGGIVDVGVEWWVEGWRCWEQLAAEGCRCWEQLAAASSGNGTTTGQGHRRGEVIQGPHWGDESFFLPTRYDSLEEMS